MNLHRLFTSFSPFLHRSLYLTGFVAYHHTSKYALRACSACHEGDRWSAVNNVHDEYIGQLVHEHERDREAHMRHSTRMKWPSAHTYGSSDFLP
jgi:hypothetical protein